MCRTNNKYMRTYSKIIIYKACVRPILTYGIETRADTKKTKSMLSAAEMKTLRTMITGKTLRDKVRNDEIRKMCGVEDGVRPEGKGYATGMIILKDGCG